MIPKKCFLSAQYMHIPLIFTYLVRGKNFYRKLNSWKGNREVHCEWVQQKPRHLDRRGGHVLFSTSKYDPNTFLSGLKERVAAAGELPRKRRGDILLQTLLQAFERFLAFGNPGKERGGEGCFFCIFKMRTNGRFVLW